MFSRRKQKYIEKDYGTTMTSEKGTLVFNIDHKKQLDGTNHFHIPSGGPFASSSTVIQVLYNLSCLSISSWCFVLDYLLSRFVSTTATNNNSDIFVIFLCKVVLSFGLLVFCTPFAIVSFLVWLPLQFLRPRPFSYHCLTDKTKTYVKETNKISSLHVESMKNDPMSGDGGVVEANFFLVSANVCLMPEFAARINNLSNTVKRAKKIASNMCGKAINISTPGNKRWSKVEETSFLCPPSSTESMNLVGGSKFGNDFGDANSLASTLCSVTSKEQVVSEVFPDCTDFICLQEVFDARATNCLLSTLKMKFPYIVYDVSWPVHRYRMTLLTSGLLIASRHPFLDIEFHAFPDGSRDDKLACKGLLMTKVFLGKTKEGASMIGYLSNTHLQAWSRTSASNARCRQLSRIEDWINQFIETSKKFDDSREVVLFNVITGDFNFDKSSYFDHNEQSCSFAKNYRDPCLDDCGQPHSWVVGTELKQQKIYDDVVCTPHGLQRMLVSELERHRYVESTIPKKTSLPRFGDGKRKIDYILYKDCNDVKLSVREFKFFTGLATLSDHLPIGMSYSCQLLPQDAT